MSRRRSGNRRPVVQAEVKANPAYERAARTVTLRGQRFEIAEKIGAMAFMRLAKLADGGMDSSDPAGLAALYDCCAAVFTDEAWKAYEQLAVRLRLSDEEILEDVRVLTEVAAGRPTGRSSVSPGGPPVTSPSSPPVSPQVPQVREVEEFTWAMAQYEPSGKFPQGRPDLQLGVVERWEATHPGEPLPQLRAV